MAGAPCQFPKKSGRCWQHPETAVKSRQSEKKAYVEALTAGTHASAAQTIERNSITVWRWRKADPEFAAACEQAEIHSLTNMLEQYEDGVFHRVLHGTAAPGVEIWWASNMAARLARLTNTEPRFRRSLDAEALVPGAQATAVVKIEVVEHTRNGGREIIVD